MSASWIQDRRRKQAAGYDEKTGAALSDIMGGLEASLAVPENERKRKLAEETAAGELGAKKTTAEATLLRAKTADKAAEESLLRKKGEETTRTEAAAAKKAADDAKAAKVEREESLLRRKSSEDTLRARLEAGTPGATPVIDDPALEELDDDAVRLIEAQTAAKKEADAEKKRKADADIEATEALADSRTADAEKKRRAPVGGGPKPKSEEAELRRRKLQLEVSRLENEAAGGPGSSTDKAKTATGEKKKQQVLEVENFTSNIDSNIDAVKKMIEDTGTFELTGPESQIMDRRLTEIATDLAKLADPGSVARNEEVELQRGNLLASGWRGLLTKDKTAQAVLDVLREDVKKRRAKAYKVRGLDVPDAATVVADDVGAVPPDDAAAADDFFSSP